MKTKDTPYVVTARAPQHDTLYFGRFGWQSGFLAENGCLYATQRAATHAAQEALTSAIYPLPSEYGEITIEDYATETENNDTMKSATIDYTTSKHGALSIDGRVIGELHGEPTMDDHGNTYYATCDGDLRIIWATTAAWDAARAQYAADWSKSIDPDTGRPTGDVPSAGILEDESQACDWDLFEVCDEHGCVIAGGTR